MTENNETVWTAEDVEQHYQRVKTVWMAFGSVDELRNLVAPLTSADSGWKSWYQKASVKTPAQWEDAWETVLLADTDTMMDAVQSVDGEFVLTDPNEANAVDGMHIMPQSTSTYYPPSERPVRPGRRIDGEREWMDGDSPMPGYKEMGAFGLQADIDFDGDLAADPDVREATEPVIEAWVRAFESLCGDRDAVFAIDSVGGCYLSVAPAATKPICDHFRGEDKVMVLNGVRQRFRDWLSEKDDLITDLHPETDLRFDAAANKNRLFKTPLSLHKRLPGVVTPIHVDDVDYSMTHPDDVDDDLVRETVQWAADFTDLRHEQVVESVVDTLFSDVAGADWKSVLENYLAQKQKDNRTTNTGSVPDDWEWNADDVTLTSDKDDVYAAVDSLPVLETIDALGGSYDTDPEGRTLTSEMDVQVNPGLWRSSKSNGSAVARTSLSGKYPPIMDLREDAAGWPIHLVAWTTGIISPGQDLTGQQWWEAVEAARAAGLNIPVHVQTSWETTDGETVENVPPSELRRVGRILGIVPDDMDGLTETVKKRVLVQMEEDGIDHGYDLDTDDRVEAASEDDGLRGAVAEMMALKK